jgi:hypothetical protein
MFEALFKSERGLARHRTAPLAEERARYIQHCIEVGATHSTVGLKCRELLWAAHLIDGERRSAFNTKSLHAIAVRRSAGQRAIPSGFSSDLRTSSGHGFDFWVGGSKRVSLTHGPSWTEKALRSLSSKSETAAAIRYALSRWRALTRYTDDGLLEIDNSAAERALRAVALGRKHFLFAGSDYGGERAAAMYTLIGSAKLNGLDPELYLRTVLTQIAVHPISQIQDPLPWNLLSKRGRCFRPCFHGQ